MNKQETVHFNVIIYGRVQGVGFRYSAVNMAAKYGLKGLVRNMPDGSVYMEIEGSELATRLMLEWSEKGPGTSRVSQVISSPGKVKGFTDFRVTYS